MLDYRLPKKVLFGWLPQPCSAGGPRKRWKDEIRWNVQGINIPEWNWHKCIEERNTPISEKSESVQCPDCARWFRSRGCLTVHQCSPQNLSQSLPQHHHSSVLMSVAKQGQRQQATSLHCQGCHCWFKQHSCPVGPCPVWPPLWSS